MTLRPPPPARCGHCRRTLYPPPGLDGGATAAAVCDEAECPLRAGPPRVLTPAGLLVGDGPVSTRPYAPPPRVRRRETPGDGLFDADTPEG